MQAALDNLLSKNGTKRFHKIEGREVEINLASAAIIDGKLLIFSWLIEQNPSLIMHSSTTPCFSLINGSYNGQSVPPLTAAVYTRSLNMVSTVLGNPEFDNIGPGKRKAEISCALHCAERWYSSPRKEEEQKILDLLQEKSKSISKL